VSDGELYEIARGRIDRRNRRWTLWAIHLAAFAIYFGLFIFLAAQTEFAVVATAILFAWGGLFTLHTILAGMAQSRDGDIESELAKLRHAYYEKPKRLELGEDGELVEVEGLEEEYTSSKRNG
jgi:hypothetical protein